MLVGGIHIHLNIQKHRSLQSWTLMTVFNEGKTGLFQYQRSNKIGIMNFHKGFHHLKAGNQNWERRDLILYIFHICSLFVTTYIFRYDLLSVYKSVTQ